MEKESNNQLPFLDVLVSRTNAGKLETQVHRKPTYTDQILNYNCNNPTTHKISSVQTLFKRARIHCSTTTSRRSEENYLMSTLKTNGYPRNFIRRCLSRASSTTRSSTEINKRIVLPYIKDVSEITTRLLRPLGIGVAHKPTNSLQTLLYRPKDATSKEDKPNIIYKINCNNYSQHYIGQSGRPLCLHLHEHQLATKRNISSLISMHMDNYGHEFDFDNVEILDRRNTKNIREFLEACHSAINRCIDIDPVY
ncbi:unnamed protein product [Heterobilharzia americana]|nr:unnamed protein product [Heterobilharzia americana]